MVHHDPLLGSLVEVAADFQVIIHPSAQDLLLQGHPVRIRDYSRRMLLRHISLFKFNPPFKKQSQLCPHGMASCFGQNEMSFGKGFQFIRGHQRTLDHLQALAGIILSPADGAGQHCLISQGFRQDFRAL